MGIVNKAVVWTGNNKVQIEERPVPRPGYGEVLLKIKAAGISSRYRPPGPMNYLFLIRTKNRLLHTGYQMRGYIISAFK